MPSTRPSDITGELIAILPPYDLHGLHRGRAARNPKTKDRPGHQSTLSLRDLLGGSHRIHRNGVAVSRARDFGLLPSQLVERV
jgi:hypothetical protein